MSRIDNAQAGERFCHEFSFVAVVSRALTASLTKGMYSMPLAGGGPRSRVNPYWVSRPQVELIFRLAKPLDFLGLTTLA
jgi:hypothetical protein